MTSGKKPSHRQFVRFAFYKVSDAWRGVADEDRASARKELAELLENERDRLPMLRTYSTIGTRADSDFLVWTASPSLEDVEDLEARIRRTQMGRFLANAYSFLAMTKRSQYDDRTGSEGRQKLRVRPGRAKYLFVYPFVKTRAWYALDFESRQAMMDAHIAVGKRYPTVKLNTTYSFGLDDQEFVVAFETDIPEDFLDLVMELRETKASEFTLRDTPIFTCIAAEPVQLLDTV